MGSNRTEMRIILVVFAAVGIVLAIALGLMWWNMQLVDGIVPVYALPTFEALEDKRFNQRIEEHVVPELRHLTENLTDNQKNTLNMNDQNMMKTLTQ